MDKQGLKNLEREKDKALLEYIEAELIARSAQLDLKEKLRKVDALGIFCDRAAVEYLKAKLAGHGESK
jgi:hypothetical protein